MSLKTKKQLSPKLKAMVKISESADASIKSEIIRLLLSGPMTIPMLLLNDYKIQTLVARLSELEDEGLIYKIPHKSRDYSFFHVEPDPVRQESRKIEKYREKQKGWIKRGLKMGFLELDEDGIYKFT